MARICGLSPLAKREARALVHMLALVSYELAVSVSVRAASARQHWDVCGLVACLQPGIPS